MGDGMLVHFSSPGQVLVSKENVEQQPLGTLLTTNPSHSSHMQKGRMLPGEKNTKIQDVSSHKPWENYKNKIH